MALIAELAAEVGSEDAIAPDQFRPYWRRALDDLLVGYDRICAFLSLHIPPGVGTPSVDHMVAKSKAWDLVYEWSNYRLACSLMNARKGVADVLDPFEIGEGWFALELDEFQVMPGRGLPADTCTSRRYDCHVALERQHLLRGAGRVRASLLGGRHLPVSPPATCSVCR